MPPANLRAVPHQCGDLVKALSRFNRQLAAEGVAVAVATLARVRRVPWPAAPSKGPGRSRGGPSAGSGRGLRSGWRREGPSSGVLYKLLYRRPSGREPFPGVIFVNYAGRATTIGPNTQERRQESACLTLYDPRDKSLRVNIGKTRRLRSRGSSPQYISPNKKIASWHNVGYNLLRVWP
jgi:hypothetical protein